MSIILLASARSWCLYLLWAPRSICACGNIQRIQVLVERFLCSLHSLRFGYHVYGASLTINDWRWCDTNDRSDVGTLFNVSRLNWGLPGRDQFPLPEHRLIAIGIKCVHRVVLSCNKDNVMASLPWDGNILHIQRLCIDLCIYLSREEEFEMRNIGRRQDSFVRIPPCTSVVKVLREIMVCDRLVPSNGLFHTCHDEAPFLYSSEWKISETPEVLRGGIWSSLFVQAYCTTFAW